MAQRERSSDRFTEWDGNLAGHTETVDTDRAWSPSRLECWATCGFRYLMRYVLDVGDREEPERVSELEPLTRGTVMHTILEEFIKEVLPRSGNAGDVFVEPWTPAHHDRLIDLAELHFERLVRRHLTGPAATWRHQRGVLISLLEEFLRVDSEHRTTMGAGPSRVEADFGPGATLPPVEVVLGDGRRLRLQGRIDRVDVDTATGRSVRVLDYKTASTKRYRGIDRDDPVKKGTQLQLGAYANAARAHLGATEVHAAYLVLDQAGRTVESVGYDWDEPRQERFVEVIGRIVDGIEAGAFDAVPGAVDNFFGGFSNCRYCAYDPICPTDRLEHALHKADAPELAVRAALVATGDAPRPDAGADDRGAST
ncbi:MAG: PD-(D/E)XK nuclease family protein [Microthrixaceae bacterium]